MVDKIILKNMKFFGYHGILPEEQKNGQYFFIDVEASLDLQASSSSDALSDTCDYSEIFKIVKNITESNKFLLIEKLAGEISREILSKNEKIKKVQVNVRKPHAPIEGEFDYMEVQIVRERK